MLQPNHVSGTLMNHRILMYTLSTCGWCRRTKALLQELGIAYDYVDVDLQTDGNRELAKEELLKWNPSSSFPTIIVDGTDCIIGYQEDRLRELASA